MDDTAAPARRPVDVGDRWPVPLRCVADQASQIRSRCGGAGGWSTQRTLLPSSRLLPHSGRVFWGNPAGNNRSAGLRLHRAEQQFREWEEV